MVPPDPATASRQTVAVIGLGGSGRAAALLALAHGHRVIGYDEGTPNTDLLPDAMELQIGADATSARPAADFAVLSPGIPPESAVLKAFAAAQIPVISEIEFAFRHCTVPVLAITGTNGKTTTTGLAAHILDSCGWTSTPCGNYGTPLSEVLLPGNTQRAVTVEVSSFQLEEITSFRPNVAVWLNFAADHLDRYTDIEEYQAAKLRVFDFQRPEDHAIVRDGEDLPLAHQALHTFSAEPGAQSDLVLADDGDAVLHHGEEIARLSSTRLRGRHNAENLMSALVAVNLLVGIPFADMAEPIASFQPPRHRCEFVRAVDGVDYINDSKATNIHALESSLKAFSQPVVLVLGGKDKGLDYSNLPALVEGRARHVIAIGEIGQGLVEQLADAGYHSAEYCTDLPAAVSAARTVAQSGDVVLLSPGTSSFDMFNSYEHRGQVFCQAVRELNT